MKACYGYIRVSTQKQGEGVSLQEQKDAIQAFASRNELTIVDWFEEKETAAKSGRPIFNQALRRLRQGKASGLIMHKIDRSARNLKDWAIVSELPDEGIDIYVATESLDFTSRGGRLTADMLAVIAADFIRNLRDETKKGLRGRLKQGLYPFRAPLGYLDNGKGQPKTPCPTTAPLIKELFELYGTGQYSLRTLHSEMSERGLRNHAGNPISLHGIETILANPFYCGIIEIKRTGDTYQGLHDPIVSPSIFRRVQDIKAGRCGPKVTRHNHLFQGLFRCGLCQRPMSPERQKGRVYYRCQDPVCPTKTIREDVLERAIKDQLRALSLSETDAAHLEREFAKDLAEYRKDDRRTSIELRIAQLKRGLDRAADLLIDGTLDEATYREKKRSTQLALCDLEEELANLPDCRVIAAHHAKFIELLKDLAALYETLKPAEKRVLLENTFSNRTVKGKEAHFSTYSWASAGQNASPVSFGDPHRHTDRTFELSPELKKVMRLFEKCSDEEFDEPA
ncbi:MAG: recombinase family protein [Rhodovulum sp.]